MLSFGIKIALCEEFALAHKLSPAMECVPGSNLLGVTAAALYRKLGRKGAWWLFHSGKVRFGNGLPIGPDGKPGWPIPACWDSEESPLPPVCESEVRSRPIPAFNPPGFISLTGQRFGPRVALRRYRAERYPVLLADQDFLADVSWDEDVPEVWIGHLREFFADAPVLLTGRKRTRRHGKAQVWLVSPPQLPSSPLLPSHGEIRVWLLSDLSACDRYGLPTVQPAAEDLGLPVGDFLPERSFRRVRRYASYNNHHRLYGRERQVIAAGSVLVFRLRESPNDVVWTDRTPGYAGFHQECGLGRYVVEPELLTRHPLPSHLPMEAIHSPAAKPPNHALAHWLLATATNSSESNDIHRWVELTLQELGILERNARRLSGVGEAQAVAPSRQHWGRVAEASEQARQELQEWGSLRRILFNDPNAICGPSNREWNLTTADQAGNQFTFADWLERKLSERPNDAPHVAALLANQAIRRTGGKK